MTPSPPVELVNRGPWTAEEDFLLKKYIEANGVGRWSTLPQKAGLMRSGKSCRLRWMNHLRPNVKRGHISPDEEDLIIRLHNLLGNRWSLIAGRVPGRTDNEVKNYWNTHLSRKFATKSFARSNTARKSVKGNPKISEKSKAKASINSLDDHTLQSRPENEAATNTLVTGNPSVPEIPTSEKEKTYPDILENGYNFGGAQGDSHYAVENVVQPVTANNANNTEDDIFLPITRFEQSIFSTRESYLDSFMSAWTWFDNSNSLFQNFVPDMDQIH